MEINSINNSNLYFGHKLFLPEKIMNMATADEKQMLNSIRKELLQDGVDGRLVIKQNTDGFLTIKDSAANNRIDELKNNNVKNLIKFLSERLQAATFYTKKQEQIEKMLSS